MCDSLHKSSGQDFHKVRRRKLVKEAKEAEGLAVVSYLDGIKGGHRVNHQASRLCGGGKQKSKSNQASAN